MKPVYEKTKKRFSFRVADCREAQNPQKRFGIHWHGNMEICRMLEGKCDFMVGDTTYIAEKGDIIFVNTGQLHSHNHNFGANKMEICLFNPSILYNLSDQVPIISPHIKYCDLKELGIADEIEECFNYLYAEINSARNYSRILFEANLLKILGLLLRNFELYEADKIDTKKASSFQKILEFISENYAEDITLETVAKKFNYSPVYISRLFNMRAGVNFKYYIDNIRVRKAAELLESSDLTIAEISVKCGYDNIRTFNNVFKRIVGCTPSDAKRNNVKNFPL